jgi:hypothetical protein
MAILLAFTLNMVAINEGGPLSLPAPIRRSIQHDECSQDGKWFTLKGIGTTSLLAEVLH